MMVEDSVGFVICSLNIVMTIIIIKILKGPGGLACQCQTEEGGVGALCGQVRLAIVYYSQDFYRHHHHHDPCPHLKGLANASLWKFLPVHNDNQQC